jgi:hypothetical protein
MNSTITFVTECRDGSGHLVEVGDKDATLEAARFGGEILCLLGDHLTGDDRRLHADCCRGPAFTMTAQASRPSLGATYYGNRLRQLSGQDPDDPAAIADWVAEQLFEDGKVVVDGDDLFYGIRSLIIINARLSGDQEQTVRSFLNNCLARDGGFGLTPGAPPDIERTYCGIATLQWMGTPEDLAGVRAHRAFVEACYDGAGHMRMRPDQDRWSLATGYWGSRCAQILGLDWPWDQVRAATQACRRSDGGYASSSHSTLWETYCALRVAAIASGRAEEET